MSRWATAADLGALFVVGPRGIGKTTVALSALRGVRDRVVTVRIGGTLTGQPYVQGVPSSATSSIESFRGAWSGRTFLLSDVDVEGLLRSLELRIEDQGLGERGRVLILDDLTVLDRHQVGEVREIVGVARGLGWKTLVAACDVDDRVLGDPLVLRLAPLDDMSMCALLRDELGESERISRDLIERIAWWSGGNPRIALEVAGALSAPGRHGDDAQPGSLPVESARDAYGRVLRNLDPTARDTLARALTPEGRPVDVALDAPGVDDLQAAGLLRRSGDALVVAQPMAALVAAQRERPEGGGSRRALPGGSAGDSDQVAVAESFVLAVMSGQRPAWDLRRPDLIGWWDALWWDHPSEVDPLDRLTARRVMAGLQRIERDGADAVSATLDADLTALGKVPALAPRGVALLIGFLLVVDRPGTARTVLDTQVFWADEEISVVDQLSLHLAEALVAAREGRFRQVRRELGHLTQLEPRCRSWLPVRGLLAVSDAILDGVAPPLTVPDDHAVRTRRALGEYAIDLASAHSVVGQPDAAAPLFAVGIEQCPWPRQGRNHVAAVAVSSLHLAPDHRELRMFTESVLQQAARPRLKEHGPDAAQARALLLTLPGTNDSPPEIARSHSAASASGASLEHQVHARIAWGCLLRRREDHSAATAAFDHAATLARLAGMDGWAAAIEALGRASGSGGGPPGWDEIDETARPIVRMVVRGATNSEVARAAFVSERTVVNRLRAVYERLGVAGRSQLVERAELDRPGWVYADDGPTAS